VGLTSYQGRLRAASPERGGQPLLQLRQHHAAIPSPGTTAFFSNSPIAVQSCEAPMCSSSAFMARPAAFIVVLSADN
jgi:hypothetical protein